MKRIKPAHSMLVALAALFVALGTGAYAASKIGTSDIKSEAVTGKKLAKNAVKSNKTKDGGLKGKDLKDETITSEKLAKDAATLWAVVDDDGTLVRGSEGASSTQLFKPGTDGSYQVDLGTDLTGCALLATLGRTDAQPLDPDQGGIGTAYRNGDAEAVYVKTRTSNGTDADRSFHLAVFC